MPFVTKESADIFRKDYVSLGELTGQSGLHHKQVRFALAAAGIKTAFDSKKFKCFFYVRSAVDKALKRDPAF